MRDGITFLNAISPSPWTLPAHASLLSGLYPFQHSLTQEGIHWSGEAWFSSQKPRWGNRYLPRVLRDAGYDTVGFSNNPWISRGFGFAEGFRSFFEMWSVGTSYTESLARRLVPAGAEDAFRPLLNSLRVILKKDSGAALTIQRFKEWFRDEHDARKPFFAFFNFMESHLPYLPPLGYTSDIGLWKTVCLNQDPAAYLAGKQTMTDEDFGLLTKLYQGELTYLDYRLGQLFAEIEQTGDLQQTLIIVTSDHGENIGEHELMDHQFCVYETLLRVPIVLYGPGLPVTGVRKTSLVQSSDVYYTILALLDLPVCTIPTGPSVLDDGYDRTIIAQYERPVIELRTLKRQFGRSDFSLWDRRLECVYQYPFKYIRSSDGKDELYDLAEDAGETNNLIFERPEIVSNLRECLEAMDRDLDGWASEDFLEEGQDGVNDEGVLRRLRDLGYI